MIFGDSMESEDILKMFREVDIDKSGFIEYSEFVMACTRESDLFSESRLKSAFKMFDSDGSGYISKVEIRNALQVLLQELAAHLEFFFS